jgi:flagellar basal-body rod modification protein FlgD
MGVSAVVKNGEIQETASQSSVKQATTSKNGMDKEAFLQLLVAQMKYQDPLEPTSNTEYISQYATFSQVEQMQNMSATLELSRASSMVGKQVLIQTTDSAGNTKEVQGMVEYVKYENNKAYVSGTLYSIDDVSAVIGQDYQDAVDLAQLFIKTLYDLPDVSELTLEHKDKVETLQKAYNAMTDYQKSFISASDVKKLQSYIDRITALKKENKTENSDKTEGGEGSEGKDPAGKDTEKTE